MVRTESDGRVAALVRAVYDWLTRPPVEYVQGQPRYDPEIERLTPRGIGDATAALMWAQRGSLTIKVSEGGYEVRGLHRLEARHHTITIPGGITVSMAEKPSRVTITAPDGQTQDVTGDDATGISGAWRAVQGVAVLEAMGLPVPEHDGGMRPSRIVNAIATAAGAMMERAELPRAQATYEIRMSGDHEEEYSDEWRTHASGWFDLGSGVYLDLSNGDSMFGVRKDEDRTARVMTAGHGVLHLPYEPIRQALERRKRSSFAAALGIAHELPVHLPAPRGNAQASRVLQLCREAVASEPDLVDAKGTSIAPLVNRHLPELMRRHADAAASAPADQLAAIDAELMTGIEGVRLAVDEALRVSANVKRDALRTQLAFLEMRHPQDPDRKALTAI